MMNTCSATSPTRDATAPANTHSPVDGLIGTVDAALRTLFAKPRARRATPKPPCTAQDAPALTPEEKRHAAGLMRVNHVGEVCAQALYTAQALTARTPEMRHKLTQAAQEETDHLAWTQERLEALDARPSLLNPLWFAGAFGIGLVAGRIGDATSLGFVVETERQVEAHLAGHLDTLPENDHASRAIVLQMKLDESAHGKMAEAAGTQALPSAVKGLMRVAAKVMTTTAYRV